MRRGLRGTDDFKRASSEENFLRGTHEGGLDEIRGKIGHTFFVTFAPPLPLLPALPVPFAPAFMFFCSVVVYLAYCSRDRSFSGAAKRFTYCCGCHCMFFSLAVSRSQRSVYPAPVWVVSGVVVSMQKGNRFFELGFWQYGGFVGAKTCEGS